MRYEPATSIIDLFTAADGGTDGIIAVSEILQCPASRVRKWRRAKGSNGTGGLIPHKYITDLLVAAALRKIDLQPGDFVTAARLEAMKKAAS